MCGQNPKLCDNKCGKLVPSIKMRRHLNEECPKRKIECEFSAVGCWDPVSYPIQQY